MSTTRRQSAEVLFGDTLHHHSPTISSNTPVFSFHGNSHSVPMDATSLSKHLLMIGGIGTGKTNAMFQAVSQIKQRLTERDVMVVFDTKGDFHKEFYRHGDVVISNDSTATGCAGADYWNIFEEIEDDAHFMENVIEISRAVFSEACKNTHQPFFPNAARDIFMAIIVDMKRRLDKEKLTNQNLLAYISGAPSQELRKMLESYNDFRSMSSYIALDDSPQTQGVLSELLQVSREVLLGNFAKHGNIGIRNLIRQKGGRTVFIEYDLGIGQMLSPIYSLLFDLAIKESLSRKHSEGNVYFICDEFKLLPYLQHIDDAVNFGRSLGIKFMVGIQNVEQIYDNYGEERARSILSGFSTNVCFRVNDAKSREYIQGLFGRNQKIESYLPTNQRSGMVETQREANVVEDWDITNLHIGEAIIGLPEQEPFVFQFEEYRKER